MSSDENELDKTEEDVVSIDNLCEMMSSLLNIKGKGAINNLNIDSEIAAFEATLLKNQEKYLTENKTLYWYKLGQLYGCSNSRKYKTLAIEPLTKAVKLDPSLKDAWNELGEAYWYSGDSELAQKCFQNALIYERTAPPLRNLSIVMRKLSVEEKENGNDYVEKGISYAKEAVKLNVMDGESWSVLGNAYLSAYFGIRQDELYAKKALSAYKQAEKSSYAIYNAELHYNKSYVLKYFEWYCDALKSLEKSLNIDNNFQHAVKLKADILKYLCQINNYTLNKGKVKPKKLHQMKKELSETKLTDYKHLILTEKSLLFNDLKDGHNDNLIVIGKVIWNIPQDGSFPFTCGLIDASGSSIVITVYNITSGKGFIIGDTIVIPNPKVSEVNFTYQDKAYKFKSIRVDHPMSLIVNKKNLPSTFFGAFSFVSEDLVDVS